MNIIRVLTFKTFVAPRDERSSQSATDTLLALGGVKNIIICLGEIPRDLRVGCHRIPSVYHGRNTTGSHGIPQWHRVRPHGGIPPRDPMAGSHGGVARRDPTAGSHGRIPWRDRTAGSHGGIERRDPTAGSHGGIPPRDSAAGYHGGNHMAGSHGIARRPCGNVKKTSSLGLFLLNRHHHRRRRRVHAGEAMKCGRGTRSRRCRLRALKARNLISYDKWGKKCRAFHGP